MAKQDPSARRLGTMNKRSADPSAKRLGTYQIPKGKPPGRRLSKANVMADLKAGVAKAGRAGEKFSGIVESVVSPLPGKGLKGRVVKGAVEKLGGKALIQQAEKKLYGTGKTISGQLVSTMNKRGEALLAKARGVMGTKGAIRAAGLGGGKPSVHPEVWMKTMNPTKIARPSRLRRYGPGK